MTSLFTSLTLPRFESPNRVVMAPMTRLRAAEDGTPTPEMADYYAQRAGAGFIVTEGIWPVSTGQSEWRVPGLETASHVAGWRAVTDAVHAAGGRIVAQLMHGGRKGAREVRYDGSHPAGPSAVAAAEPIRRPDGGKHPSPVPHVLTPQDIAGIVENHAQAARRAIDAGFDGVELHAANSYLSHQFLADNSNLRTDGYGGSDAGRMRIVIELVEAISAAVGAERLGVRLSPGNPQFGMAEADPAPRYRLLLSELARHPLAYLHLTDNDDYPALADLRPLWPGILVANVGENRAATTRAGADATLQAGLADAVSFGRGFLSNPDLVRRLREDLPWNPLDESRLYTPGPRGYSDYPPVSAPAARPAP